jgi:hypothetical protein
MMEPVNGGQDLHVSVTMPSIEVSMWWQLALICLAEGVYYVPLISLFLQNILFVRSRHITWYNPFVPEFVW